MRRIKYVKFGEEAQHWHVPLPPRSHREPLRCWYPCHSIVVANFLHKSALQSIKFAILMCEVENKLRFQLPRVSGISEDGR